MKSEHRRAMNTVVVVVGTVLGLTWMLCCVAQDWRMANEPLHSAMETTGGIVAVIMAVFMLQRESDPYGGRLVAVALGFLAMGILGVAHAIPHAGQSFVFLRSAASLFGGLGFVHVCLPERFLLCAIPRKLLLASLVAGVSILVAVWALIPGAPLPVMIRDGHFTGISYVINVVAGVCFLSAAIRLMADFRRSGRRSLCMLGGMAILFGLANVLFSFSTLWDDTWWSWHLVQLIVSGVVFYEVMAEHRATLARLTEALKERERAEAALSHLNETLERHVTAQTAELTRSNHELTQFAYVASHDLQEPLRSVTGFLDILKQRKMELLDAEGKEFVGFAREGAERMRVLIQDLLKYSRVSSEARTLAPCDLNALLGRVLVDLRIAIGECGARVEVDPLPVVSGDTRQLGQVFQNLISNALKFRGPVAPQIRISAKRTGEFWEFSVADNGIGIEPRFADEVFEVFRRLHTREEYAGSGIGLAICRKIIHRHGGEIWVQSSPGHGSNFQFVLPAAGKAPADGESPQTIAAPAS